MARKPRITGAGATYHVTARGNRRQDIYADDYDRRLFLRILEDAVAAHHVRCVAYCLLGNHFHLLVETPRAGADLAAGMHRLNGRYAQCFNHRHGVEGHLFQDRFHSTLVEGEGHLLSALRYLFLNPVVAGLCAAPEEWPWSSYAPTIGTKARPPFLSSEVALGLFAAERRRAAELLAQFVAGAAP